MSAVAKERNIKPKFNNIFGEAMRNIREASRTFFAFLGEVDCEEPDKVLNSVDGNLGEALDAESEAREKLEKMIFGDGYNKIENKLNDTKINVSGKVEKISDVERAKGGREKTRIDED